MHEACRAVLDGNVGKPLTVTTIVDLMNLVRALACRCAAAPRARVAGFGAGWRKAGPHSPLSPSANRARVPTPSPPPQTNRAALRLPQVGKCVVAGNVRRTAEIAFGDPHSDEYIDLKNYDKNPARMAHGWTSNNSVFAELGMRYDHLVPRITANGEPGFAWLHNMRNYGRMNGTPDSSDWRASGGNPCLEQTLESYELCCLVETFPNRHQSVADFEKTLEAAFLYAKTVTLGETHWAASNRVMLRNRRIGCSISGVAQFISRCAARRPPLPAATRRPSLPPAAARSPAGEAAPSPSRHSLHAPVAGRGGCCRTPRSRSLSQPLAPSPARPGQQGCACRALPPLRASHARPL